MFPVRKKVQYTDRRPISRKSSEEIKEAFLAISSHPILTRLLDAMPIICLLLNEDRQIVFANKATVALMRLEDRYALSGQRPGEALHCIHAFELEDGCGTTAYCRMCGADRELRNEKRWDQDGQECRILRSNGLDALDLRVSAAPITVDTMSFIILTMIDVGHEKRRSALERIFFHDILNTAGTIRGFSELLSDKAKGTTKKRLDLIRRLSARLVEEIEGQRQLRAAENDELQVRPTTVNALKLLEEIRQQYQDLPSTKGRRIELASGQQEVLLKSDPVLLRRVLGNLVKNALEASRKGDVVLIGADSKGEAVEFWVFNTQPMSPDVQLQMFQRSFSTKGSGRGLGTFGVKLISEKYLNSQVSFESSPGTGTIFRITCPKDVPA